MKKLLLLGALWYVGLLYGEDLSLEETWRLTKNVSPLSYTAEFKLKKGELFDGKVVRTGLLTPRYYYDLYNAKNDFSIRGITRVFSLGMLFTWGTEIDLYAGEESIGLISGEVWSSSRAKFSFWNAEGQAVAYAYLSDESCEFLIVSAEEGDVMAQLVGTACGDASSWQIKSVKEPLKMDERALLIFAAFIADFQKHFVRPPKREIYYYDRRDH